MALATPRRPPRHAALPVAPPAAPSAKPFVHPEANAAYLRIRSRLNKKGFGSFRKVRITVVGSDQYGGTSRETGTYGPQGRERWRQTQRQRREAAGQSSGYAGAGGRHPSPGGHDSRDNSPGPQDHGSLPPDSPPTTDWQAETAGDISQQLINAYIREHLRTDFYLSSAQNWGRRRESTRTNWQAQVGPLVDAYLAYTHSCPTSGAPPPVLYPDYSVSAESLRAASPGHIHLVDISGVYSVPLSTFSAHGLLNAALLACGYLGSTPIRPSIAFSVRTLLLFTRLRLRARTGKHNFARVLCDLHNITFTRSFRNRLADTIDALTSILRAVDDLVRSTLGRNEDWRARNACPACSYKCVGEEELLYARQFALDGNNSMKRFATSGSHFDKAFPFYYFLTRNEVDRFAGDVAAAPPPGPDNPVPTSDCSHHWRNARPESEKASSWEALDETGMFICLCRHGLVAFACDMWQSGELAKYPLAMDAKLVELFGSEGTLQIGYDIGCAHSVTARRVLGASAADNIRFVVGSFHGYAHERVCQLRFHPRYIKGTGREDFEGCERLFSVNNFIASLIRHATPFHRHELIEASLAAWDAEKYAGIGSLLLSKFREAKEKIAGHAESEALRVANARYSDEFCQQLLDDELEYLRGTAPRSEETIQEELAADYSDALRRLWKAIEDRDRLPPQINQYHGPGNVETGRSASSRKWLAVQRKVRSCEDEVSAYEERMGIALHERWTCNSEGYLSALQAGRQRAYNKALDELERAVADRTAVFAKLNKRGTGYKLRKQISQAMSRRGAALGNAIQRYNTAARALQPPRATLTREQVLSTEFLSDFPLLRHDIGDREWTRPAIRNMVNAWAETQRAHEELKRVRIEAIRTRTWIRDEERLLDAKVQKLASSSVVRHQLLAQELDARAQLLHQVHTAILNDLRDLDTADGQAMARHPAQRVGEPAPPAYTHRAVGREQLPPLAEGVVRRVHDTHSAPRVTESAESNPSDVSDDGSVLDEVGIGDLDTFLEAVDEIGR